MAIPVGVTKKAFTKMKKQLLIEQEFYCMDRATFILANLVGLHLSQQGVVVKAKIHPPAVASGQ